MLEVVFQFFYIPAVSRIFFSLVTAASVNSRLPKIEIVFKSILSRSRFTCNVFFELTGFPGLDN